MDQSLKNIAASKGRDIADPALNALKLLIFLFELVHFQSQCRWFRQHSILLCPAPSPVR
jgi:hypothetical protein